MSYEKYEYLATFVYFLYLGSREVRLIVFYLMVWGGTVLFLFSFVFTNRSIFIVMMYEVRNKKEILHNRIATPIL